MKLLWGAGRKFEMGRLGRKITREFGKLDLDTCGKTYRRGRCKDIMQNY